MPQPERAIVVKVIAVAKSLGFWVTKIHGNAFTLAGTPDVLAIRDGKAHWMEVKCPGEQPTKIQLHRMRELEQAGCRVAVVYSPQDARRFLEAA